MEIVTNTSPLIFLAKLNRLTLLNEIYSEIYAPAEVITEALSGLQKGYADALQIKLLIEQGKIKSKDVPNTNLPLGLIGLHRGEIAVITLAKQLKIDTVLVDDYAAIKSARYMGLKPMSTPFLLLLALKSKKCSFNDFESDMNRLVDFGYWLSPTLYKKFLDKARDLSKD